MGKLDGRVCRGCKKMVCNCGPKKGKARTISQKYPWKDPASDQFQALTWEDANKSREGLDTTSSRNWNTGNNGSKRRKINKLRWK
jgi:hypothetical protein|tara:strand:- start:438 stop:692 length:255 start_codon:yes stop_codon:yes gene_type:complete